MGICTAVTTKFVCFLFFCFVEFKQIVNGPEMIPDIILVRAFNHSKERKC